MACAKPLVAYYAKEVNPTGKRSLVFDQRLSFSGVPVRLPCGQCVHCRLERSRQWAMRCLHEKSLYGESAFITLTYDEKKLPPDMSLSVRELQLFMKRLRKKTGDGVRFYACGEYGAQFGRPHYHVLLFNRDFPDKKFFKETGSGDKLYTSVALDNVWGNGLSVFGSVTFESCAYVARYVVDKITGPLAEAHYKGRVPEFATRSMRPGIGADWFDKYGGHAYKHDSVIMREMEMQPPKYYDVRMEALDPVLMDRLKRKRMRKLRLVSWFERTDLRRRRARETFELKKQAFFAKKGV